MKTAAFSLVISITILILSLFQFNRYQTFVHNTQSNIQQLNNTFKTNIESLAGEITTLGTQKESLLKNLQTSTIKLTAAESLVLLAAGRLQTDHDAKAAITLLTMALEKIQLMEDPHLLPLQQALANDVTALQNVSLPNIEDLFLRVSAIIEQTALFNPRNFILERQTVNTPAAQPPAEPTGTKNGDSWKQTLLNSFGTVKDLVKVRHSSQPIEPILSETQQALVHSNLRMMLEQVRSSILLRQEKIYQDSVKNVLQWLVQYYDNSLPDVITVQQALESLQTAHLKVELPVMTSLKQFDALR